MIRNLYRLHVSLLHAYDLTAYSRDRKTVPGTFAMEGAR
jgi:hypothetical protein